MATLLVVSAFQLRTCSLHVSPPNMHIIASVVVTGACIIRGWRRRTARQPEKPGWKSRTPVGSKFLRTGFFGRVRSTYNGKINWKNKTFMLRVCCNSRRYSALGEGCWGWRVYMWMGVVHKLLALVFLCTINFNWKPVVLSEFYFNFYLISV